MPDALSKEFEAMRTVADALSGLSSPAQQRVVQWAISRSYEENMPQMLPGPVGGFTGSAVGRV